MSDDIHCSEIAPRFLLVPINSFKKKIMCSQTKNLWTPIKIFIILNVWHSSLIVFTLTASPFLTRIYKNKIKNAHHHLD